MKLTHRIEGDALILNLDGQLTGGPEADQLVTKIRSAVESGIRLVILDMEGITWVNSTGLGKLIASHLSLRQSGGALRFVRVPRRIATILGVTRLNTVFEIYPTEGDARRAQLTGPPR